MSQWKSFTVGGDQADGGVGFFSIPQDEVPASAPVGAQPQSDPSMDADAAAAKWGVEVEPVSIERIERVVEGDGLPHGSNEVMVVTELDGKRVQIHREPADSPWLQGEARIDLGDGGDSFSVEELRAAANEWNTRHLQPTVFPVEVSGAPGLALATRFFVGEGLSDRQIHTMLRRGLSVAVQAMREVPGLLARDAH